MNSSNPLRAPRVLSLFAICTLLLTGCASKPAIRYALQSEMAVSDPQFVRTMGNLLGPPLVGGNSVLPLRNGGEIFPAMLESIHAARKAVNFETYIYWSGDVGSRITDALCDRAAAGVRVNVIVDAVGANKIDKHYLKRLREAGAQVVEYHKLKFYDVGSATHFNNRTHRKLLIVDGIVGFIGGVGIADEWDGNADSPKHWRDMHYRIEGPVVAQLQAAFEDNWVKTTGEVLNGEVDFPQLSERGEQYCQVFKSGVEGGSTSMELMYLLSISSARHTIRMGNAYFVPNDLMIKALLDAKRRGVKVQIIVPGPHIDEKLVRTASHSRWGELLREGVEIYEFQPTMYHTKLLIVDDLWVSIGSANFDERSFKLNDEANLNVLNASFAAGESRIFDEDLSRSKAATYEQWERRPMLDRLMENFSRLFTPLL